MSTEEELQRYKEALTTIVSLLEPLYSEHTTQCLGCEGCLYEWEEALTIGMNTLAGLDPNAHVGPWHRIGEGELCSLDNRCQPCKDHIAEREQREQAWRDQGFVKDEKGVWHVSSLWIEKNT